ncbi:MAG: DUF951 domain-containing protein [Chloroflexi bacterium]|nr:DUF951 domain-containing protein [Chloroflexota bacterium]
MTLEIKPEEVVQLRKPHACGANRWRIYRVGADIGLQCLACGRRQLLPRKKFERAFKRKLETDDPKRDPSN